MGFQFGSTESVLRFPLLQTQSIAALAQLGAQWLRVDAPLLALDSWPGVAPTTATSYNATAANDINALKVACNAAGLKLLVVVTATITTSSVNGVSFSPADFGSAMAWLAGQCPGITWELNNEPDLAGITAAVYTSTVTASYSAMKAADPTCTVVAGVISKVDSGGGRPYWTACYTAGIKGNFDVASVHTYNRFSPYPVPFDPGLQAGGGTVALNANLVDYQAIMTTNSDASPLWITEFGWDTATPGSGGCCSLTEQGLFLVQWMIELAALSIPVVMSYSVADGASPPDYGLVDSSFNPKPSFAAVQSFIRQPVRMLTDGTRNYRRNH